MGYGTITYFANNLIEEGVWLGDQKHGAFKVIENGVESYWKYFMDKRKSKTTKKVYEREVKHII